MTPTIHSTGVFTTVSVLPRNSGSVRIDLVSAFRSRLGP